MAFNNLRKLAVFALSAAMIVSLGACGTSEKSDSAASSDSESSSNTTGYDVSGVTKDDDIAAMLPESVTKDGKLTVGMDTSYAPAEFLAEDGKTPVGFDVDIAKAVQAALQKLMDDGTYRRSSSIGAWRTERSTKPKSIRLTSAERSNVRQTSHTAILLSRYDGRHAGQIRVSSVFVYGSSVIRRSYIARFLADT